MCLVPIYLEVKLDKSIKFCHYHWHCTKIFFVCPAAEVTCSVRAVSAGAKISDTDIFYKIIRYKCIGGANT